MNKKEHINNIALYLILTIFTCGIFNLYWNYKQMQACNELSGEQKFNWAIWFFVSIITCGLYHLYYQYQMGATLVQIEKDNNLTSLDILPLISLLGTLMGLSLIVDMIHQHEINKICEAQ